ncbi:MAG: NTP transferase domain-containing protein [Candidatus Marinimicrobia bacterium]|nr:NTP transferase domain-containing protein [Candidatus Neomarinimicrobiota bacterium]
MKADGIILSAGFSARAEGFKPELDIAGKPLLMRTVESMLNFCETIIVVGGHEFERVARILENIPQCTAVKNENFRAGMFSSVKTGVKEVKAERFLCCRATSRQ